MSKKTETEVIFVDDLGMNATILTDEQVHHVYDELSEVDKTSTDNLTAAAEETETTEYTEGDNTVIEAGELIPGVDVVPANIAEDIHENENDIKDVLCNYDLDDESTIQMLKVIDEYKAGNQSSLYSRLPDKMKTMRQVVVLILNRLLL